MHWRTPPTGGNTYNGTDVVNSGLVIAPKPHPFALTFTAPGAYHDIGIVHPGMDDTVTVLPTGP